MWSVQLFNAFDFSESSLIIHVDQTKPICKRCENGRFVCHGYESFSEFVDETNRIHDSLKKQNCMRHDNFDQSAKGLVTRNSTRFITPRIDDEAGVVVDLAHALRSPHTSFRHLGWMTSVLQHPETPKPLSCSVCALASVFFGKANTASLVLLNGVNIYYKALKLVQSQVQDRTHVDDEDLPLSVLCLCVYELVAPTRPAAWINHAAGLAKIVGIAS